MNLTIRVPKFKSAELLNYLNKWLPIWYPEVKFIEQSNKVSKLGVSFEKTHVWYSFSKPTTPRAKFKYSINR